MFQVRVERDSIREDGRFRLTSFVIEFPRVVLAEAVTHRLNYDTWGDLSWAERTTTTDISKNSASSRAIPTERMLKKIEDDPYLPEWTTNQKGMQGASCLDQVGKDANGIWLAVRNHCVQAARDLAYLGIHKQDANRIVEPFAWITQIVTSSRWDNFFALRCHEAAHPAIRTIARMMFLARRKSVPRILQHGQWHLPFVPPEEEVGFFWQPSYKLGDQLPSLLKYSAARCAWISYENHDKDGSPEALSRTFDRLLEAPPIHASPSEHQATPEPDMWIHDFPVPVSNLTGWIQVRKLLNGEETFSYDPSEEEIESWDLGYTT